MEAPRQRVLARRVPPRVAPRARREQPAAVHARERAVGGAGRLDVVRHPRRVLESHRGAAARRVAHRAAAPVPRVQGARPFDVDALRLSTRRLLRRLLRLLPLRLRLRLRLLRPLRRLLPVLLRRLLHAMGLVEPRQLVPRLRLERRRLPRLVLVARRQRLHHARLDDRRLGLRQLCAPDHVACRFSRLVARLVHDALRLSAEEVADLRAAREPPLHLAVPLCAQLDWVVKAPSHCAAIVHPHRLAVL